LSIAREPDYRSGMKLPGRLGATTLGDLLGALHRERASGTLELVEDRGVTAGRVHRLFLSAGQVEQVETSLRALRLGELLGRYGWLSSDGARWLSRRLIEAPARRTGELLIERGLVAPEIVAAALRRQLRARLEALFGLGEALVRFHVPRPRAFGEAMPPLSASEVLHGRPRARDRGRRPRTFDTEARRPAQTSVEPRVSMRRERALRTLGLNGEVDRVTLQRTFRSLAVRLHPDRHPAATPDQKAELMRRFAEVSAAYHLLVA
jgi:hypothetical protein